MKAEQNVRGCGRVCLAKFIFIPSDLEINDLWKRCRWIGTCEVKLKFARQLIRSHSTCGLLQFVFAWWNPSSVVFNGRGICAICNRVVARGWDCFHTEHRAVERFSFCGTPRVRNQVQWKCLDQIGKTIGVDEFTERVWLNWCFGK